MDVPELVPMDDYDANQAKLEASVKWLITKAYDRDVPDQLQEPFYYNQQDVLCCSDGLVTSLVTSDLYNRACAILFSQAVHGHEAVISLLSRRGLYVLDVSQSAVTPQLLARKPIATNAHLSLIDTLMSAWTNDLVTIEKVVQAVRKFASFNASSELPYDSEDAVLFWLNKVCGVVRQRLEESRQDKENNVQGRGSKPRAVPVIPFMHELLKDIYDCCCLATAISFYCPTAIRQHHVVMEENIGTADAMHNIQLILEFCAEYLPIPVAHLSLNDLFYTHHALKTNLLVFLAELFYYLETEPIRCVQIQVGGNSQQQSVHLHSNSVIDTGSGEGDFTGDNVKARAQSAKFPASVPISEVTKRSFHHGDNTAGSPDLANTSQSAVPFPRQPLLPRRNQPRSDPNDPSLSSSSRGKLSRRSHSFTVADRPRQSVTAWQQNATTEQHGTAQPSDNPLRGFIGARTAANRNHSNGTAVHSNHHPDEPMLAGVSIDSEMSVDLSTDTSMTLTEFEDTPRSQATPHPTQAPPPATQATPSQGMAMKARNKPMRNNSLRDAYRKPQDIVFNLQGNNQPQNNTGTAGQQERLMPAFTQPAKEKTNSHSKGVESGEQNSPASRKTNNRPKIDIQNKQEDSDDDPSDSEFQTPSSESAPFFSIAEEKVKPKESTGASPRMASNSRQGRNTATGSSGDSQPRSGTAQSFVLQEQYTEEGARAAGIPVVHSGEYPAQPPRRQWAKPQAPLEGSPRNSSDGSDQELRKIHADHRETESHKGDSFFINGNGETVNRPDSLRIAKPNSSKLLPKSQQKQPQNAQKTSFAQIQRERSTDRNLSETHSNNDDKPVNLSLKEQYAMNKSNQKPGKKTTFAALPNQTTWSDFVNQKSSTTPGSQKNTPGSDVTDGDSAQTPQAEILNVRMMMEERRRKYEQEKRKTEMEASRQRQRVGKQAFMQVITKNKDDPDPSSHRDKRVIQKTIHEEDSNRHVSPQQQMRPSQSPARPHHPRTSSLERTPGGGDSGSNLNRRQPSNERTPRSNAVQRSRSSVERTTPRMVERRSPAPRHDRPPSAQEEKLQQLMQRLDSLETASSTASSKQSPHDQRPSRSQATPSPRKPFSRENIQSTIENAKRWVSTEDNHSSPPVGVGGVPLRENRPAANNMGRPQSYHVGERPPQMTPSRRSRAGSVEPQNEPVPGEGGPTMEGEYSSSLDKLNTSLSELQGEIMSLSLNNDVSSQSPTPHMTSNQMPRHAAPPTMTQSDDVLSQGIRDNFFLMPRDGEVKPMGDTRMSHSDPAQPPPSAGRNDSRQLPAGYGYSPQPHVTSSPVVTSQMYGYASPHSQQSPPQAANMPSPHYAQPGYNQGPQYPAYSNQGGSPYAGGAMNVSAPYAGPPPGNDTFVMSSPVQMATSSGYSPHPVVGSSPAHGQVTNMPVSHWGAPIPPPHLQHENPAHSSYQYDLHGQPQRGMSPQTGNTMEAHNTYAEKRSPMSSSMYSSAHETLPQSPLAASTGTHAAATYQGLEYTHTDQQHPPSHHTQPPVDTGNADINNDDPNNGRFYIDFDEGAGNAPLKPRPKLGSERRNTETNPKQKQQKPAASSITAAKSSSTGTVPTNASPANTNSSSGGGDSQGDLYRAPSPKSLAAAMHDAGPAEAFVIGVDDEHENQELSDIEKRRQKFMQLQAQRKEDENSKKKQLEEKRLRMREQQYQKQAQAEQKKAEDKARREQIYADYQRRKEERERGEQDSRGGNNAPVSKRVRAAKARQAQRPKSQPTFPMDEKFSASSHSSQEDLRGRSPANDRLFNYHGAPVHPERAALFGIPSTGSAQLPHPPEMYDGPMADMGPPHEGASYAHHRNASPAPPGYHGYGLTHRRPPTPDGVHRSSHGDHANNNMTEYSGPKLFKKPSSKSNKQVIIQAISACCLAGVVNNSIKKKVLEIINQSEITQFVILFRDAGQQFRGLYTYNLETEDIFKIHGVGPKTIASKMLERFYKYNCGAKKFSEVTTTKHMSATIDAVCLYNSHWQKKRVEKKPPAGYC